MDTSHLSDSDGDGFGKMVIIGSHLKNSPDINKAAEKLNKEVIYTDKCENLIEEYETLFVFERFEGEVFEHLRKLKKRIISTALLLHETNIQEAGEVVIPYHRRPLYSKSMLGMTVVFDELRSKLYSQTRDIKSLSQQAQFMGASLREDLIKTVTHLVAVNSNSDEYRLALNFEIKILTCGWITYCWNNRNNFEFKADSTAVIEHFQWKPFKTLSLLFHRFDEEDEENMISIAEMNQGLVTTLASSCTHVVVNETKGNTLCIGGLQEGTYVVTSQWFWHSIYMMARAQEYLYKFKDDDGFKVPLPVTRMLERTESQMEQSKLREIVNLITSGKEDALNQSAPSRREPETKRELVINELYTTECNYLKILTSIVEDLKEVAERPGGRVGPILTPQESKEIFSGIIPIRNIHLQIKDQLEEYIQDWQGERPLGDAYCSRRDQLLKSYQQFINFLELAKNSIQSYKKKNLRFLALLNSWEKMEKCGRQSLEDLMMRPVQRLPSVSLLMTEINKLTPPDHRDHYSIQLALKTLEEVLREINRNKSRAEEYKQILEISGLIKAVPTTLISSSRSYICRINCVEVTDVFDVCRRHLTIFLFSDCVLITKRLKLSKYEKHEYEFMAKLELYMIKKLLNVLYNDQLESMGLIITDNKRLHLGVFFLKDPLVDCQKFMGIITTKICDFYGCFQSVMVASFTRDELNLRLREDLKLTSQISLVMRRVGTLKMPGIMTNHKPFATSSLHGSTYSINTIGSEASYYQMMNPLNLTSLDDTLNQTTIYTPSSGQRDRNSEEVDLFLTSMTTPRQTSHNKSLLKIVKKRFSLVPRNRKKS